MSGLTLKVDNRKVVLAAVHKACGQGLDDATEFLLEEANRTVPIEEKILMGSGVATVDPVGLKGAVSYDTPYAIVQHEKTHLRHDQGRRAKWLELTFKENGQRVRDYLADRLRAVAR